MFSLLCKWINTNRFLVNNSLCYKAAQISTVLRNWLELANNNHSLEQLLSLVCVCLYACVIKLTDKIMYIYKNNFVIQNSNQDNNVKSSP